jgi:type I restriction enzyme R subunit
LKLQQHTNKDADATRESIADDVTRLPDFIVNDSALQSIIQLGASPERLATAKPAELDALADALASQMKYRRQQPNAFLLLDLPDSIDMRGYVLLRNGTEPVYVQEYRERIEKRINELVTTHPAMLTIQRGETPDDWELIDLERTLRHELGSGDTELTEINIRKAYGLKVGSLLAFLRALLGLDNVPDYGDVVARQFDAFVQQHTYNSDKILFLRTVQSVLLQRRRIEPADLYEAPFTNWGSDAVERLFTPREVDEVLEFAGDWRRRGGVVPPDFGMCACGHTGGMTTPLQIQDNNHAIRSIKTSSAFDSPEGL